MADEKVKLVRVRAKSRGQKPNKAWAEEGEEFVTRSDKVGRWMEVLGDYEPPAQPAPAATGVPGGGGQAPAAAPAKPADPPSGGDK